MFGKVIKHDGVTSTSKVKPLRSPEEGHNNHRARPTTRAEDWGTWGDVPKNTGAYAL